MESHRQIRVDLDELRGLVEKSELWVHKGGKVATIQREDTLKDKRSCLKRRVSEIPTDKDKNPRTVRTVVVVRTTYKQTLAYDPQQHLGQTQTRLVHRYLVV